MSRHVHRWQVQDFCYGWAFTVERCLSCGKERTR